MRYENCQLEIRDILTGESKILLLKCDIDISHPVGDACDNIARFIAKIDAHPCTVEEFDLATKTA
jgi:hypothetical protein